MGIDLKVPHSPLEKIAFFYKDHKFPIFLAVTIIGIFTYVQLYYLKGLNDARSRAEAITLNVKDFGAKGDGAADDTSAFKAAISAAGTGDTVSVSEGTYKITSSLSLKSGITVSGKGTIYMPAKTSDINMFVVDGTTGTTIDGLTLTSDFVSLIDGTGQHASYVYGVHGKSTNDFTYKNITTRNLDYALAFVDGSTPSKNLKIDNLNSRQDAMPIYLNYVQGGTFTNLNLYARTDATKLEHDLYLSKRNTDLVFENIILGGSVGYVIQLYNSSDSSYNGKRITFRHVRIDNPNQAIVVQGYEDVSFEDLVGNASGDILKASGFAKINGVSNLTFDGFEVAGTSPAFYIGSSSTNLTLANGKYHQSSLIGNLSSVSGYSVTNVEHDSNTFVMPDLITVPSLTPTSTPVLVTQPVGTNPTPTLTPSVPATTETIKFHPSEDATIFYDKPNNNYGGMSTDSVDAKAKQDFLIKFNVSGVGSKYVNRAILKLYNENGSDKGGDFRATSNTWSESGITWNNAPSSGTLIKSLGSVSSGNWYSVDLTSYIKGDGIYSLRVGSTSTNGADYSSKDSNSPPVLELTVDPYQLITDPGISPTPTPSPTTKPTSTPTPTPTKIPTPTPTVSKSYGITVMAIDTRKYRILSCSISANISSFSGTTSYTRTSSVPFSVALTAPSKCQGRNFASWSTGATSRSTTASDLTANDGETVYIIYYK